MCRHGSGGSGGSMKIIMAYDYTGTSRICRINDACIVSKFMYLYMAISWRGENNQRQHGKHLAQRQRGAQRLKRK